MNSTHPIKVLLFITKSNWGGAQKYVYELATSLPKHQYEVKVVTGGAGPLVERLHAAGIETISIASMSNEIGIRKEIDTLKSLWNIIRTEKPTVFHVNSSKAGIMGALMGRILSVPNIVFTAHGWAFNEDRPVYQKIILRVMHWMTLVFAHHTVAVSQNIASAFDGWPLIRNKISVIHNGIKPGTGYARNGARQALVNIFPQLKTAFEQKNTYIIGTIAELHPVKNLSNAILAVNELVHHTHHKHVPDQKNQPPRITYLIMGEGRERPQLEVLINKLGLSEHVFLLGHVADAFQYIKAFDTFLLSSNSEALAYVLLEAGLQETPVIATAVGGIPEIIEDMQSGILIQARKPSEIAHAVEFYIEHPETAREYAHNLHLRIKKEFTLERMVKEMEEVYERNKGMNV